MNWTDCAVIEQIPGKMSGAPVLRHSRVRPQDILANVEQGPEWIAEAHCLPVNDVRQVLEFYNAHSDDLPLEYFPPEQVAELGLDGIDWSTCPIIDDRAGDPVIRGTPVRPIDLIANAAEGDANLASSYSLPIDNVRSVLSYYRQHKRQLAPAV